MLLDIDRHGNLGQQRGKQKEKCLSLWIKLSSSLLHVSRIGTSIANCGAPSTAVAAVSRHSLKPCHKNTGLGDCKTIRLDVRVVMRTSALHRHARSPKPVLVAFVSLAVVSLVHVRLTFLGGAARTSFPDYIIL